MLEEKIEIKNKIYEIRGQQVMLDSDLAKLYQVETKVFLQAVKRNIKRFPDNFMFQLTNVEYNYLRSQIVTSNSKINHGGRRYMPYVFTEQGISMLASILHSVVAIDISIKIINIFVEMRKYISNNLIEQKYINDLVIEHDKDIKSLKSVFVEFKEKTNHIFFEGQIYDAYSLLIDILNKAKKEIIIIDNYAGKELLDILKDCKT
ncbi:MAG: ORF6N domain-containing protein, partial [Bacilli bacterium]|nr:ORF6N domain-containing protein [Bacilli bacterium]